MDDEPDLDMKPANANLMSPNPEGKESDPIADAIKAGVASELTPKDATAQPSIDLSGWASENIPEFKAEYTAVKMEDLDTPEKLLAAQEKLLAYQEECVKYAESLKQQKEQVIKSGGLGN